jgi:hypothetical protein
MGLFGDYILEKKETSKLEQPVHSDIVDVEVAEPTELDNQASEQIQSVDDQLKDIISDMTDEEKEVLLDHAYALVLADVEDDGEESDESDSSDEDNEITEASIKHLTAAERTAGKMTRRTPKWKRKARIRYIKNKKCPAGTTYSSDSKSCTRLNIDLSRLQKMIAKMRIRG